MIYTDRNQICLDALAEGAAVAQEHQVLVEFLMLYSSKVADQRGIVDSVYSSLIDLDIDWQATLDKLE